MRDCVSGCVRVKGVVSHHPRCPTQPGVEPAPTRLEQVWQDAGSALHRTAEELDGLALRAARLGAYDAAAELGRLAGGVRSLADETHAEVCPEWLAERVE